MTDNKKHKPQYKLKNWSSYNEALRQRGSITLWVSDDAASKWYGGVTERGRPQVYSDFAIESSLTLQAVFKLPLRATQGLMDSLFKILNQGELQCPDYTTLSRRRKSLSPNITSSTQNNDPLNIAIDSTGIKVYGEGEWKTRKHGKSKRRTWRKVHLAVNVKTHEVVAEVTTENNIGDSEVFEELLSQIQQPIASCSADGAYDTKECHKSLHKLQAQPKIPPRRGAQVQCPQITTSKYDPALKNRDTAIEKIKQLGDDDDARKQWKKEINYHQRSLSETAMFRRKTLFSNKFSSRTLQNQKIESKLIIKAMNIMTKLGMPDSYPYLT